MRILVQDPSAPVPSPGTTRDVDVDAGTAAGTLRRHLALLTGDVRWAASTARLVVDGTVLDDGHPAGVPPLVAGARTSLHRTGDDAVVAAARADRHVAVVAGPDAGHVRALTAGTRVTTTGPGAAPGPGTWLLADEALAGVRVEVRRAARTTWVRVLGARGRLVDRPRTHRARVRGGDGDTPRGRRPRRRRRRRRVGRCWRPWRPGGLLEVAGTVLALRAPEGARRPGAGRALRRPPAPWLWSSLASSVTGVALAAALRQPLLLVGAAAGVLGLVASRPSGAPEQPGDGAEPRRPPATDVAAARTRTVLDGWRPVAHEPVDADAGWPCDGTLALVGDRARTLAAARALVLRTLADAPAAALVVRSDAPAPWAWARWLEPGTALPTVTPHEDEAPDVPARSVVVVDGADGDCARWRAAAPPAHRLLVLVPPGARPPGWVRTVVQVERARAVRTGPDGRRTSGPAELVQEPVAEDAARRLASLRHARPVSVPAGRGSTGGPLPPGPGSADPLPASVPLGALPGVPPPHAAEVAARWAEPLGTALRVPLGRGADGAVVELDLDGDGPHLLVAGTTGSGKSELLTTLVLGLALRHPPQRLAVLLADFKGGTGLGPLAGLPHVVDHVDDLDPDAAGRTLTGLRAELRRRERVLAAAGVADLRALDPDAPDVPPRLVLVVDELRALADDVPDAMAVLARTAAQGRALGVHLVLATQRPAGAVTADLRANVTQRVALRVADEADARDVVDVADPAHLDPAHPGRAVLRVGARAPRPVQVARARRATDGPDVRLLPTATAASTWCPPSPPPDEDDVRAWVRAARDAARGLAPPAVPWCPALPHRVEVLDVPPGPGLALALADVPEEQRREPVRWDPDDGPLLVLGGPRSGRTTALLTVAAQAAWSGLHVHALGPVEADVRATVDPHRLGTVVPADDVHRAGLLLRRLRTPQEGRPAALLVVDRLDVVLEQLGRHARGTVADMLAATWRDPVAGLGVAASAAVVPQVTRLVGAFPVRVVLPSADPAADALAGVPAGLATGRFPGRGVVCGGEEARVCQVALPPRLGSRDADRPPQRGSVPSAPAGGGDAGPQAAPPPVRVVPLPRRAVPPADVTDAPDGLVPLGAGGDAGQVVHAEATRPLVVAGSPGTGRTTALRAVARHWAGRGHRVLRLAAGPGEPQDADAPWTTVDASALPDVAALRGPGAPPVVVVVDDADELDRAVPGSAEAVEELLLPGSGVHVAALATTSAHAATAFRGPVARALRARHVLVLDPHDTDAAALLGPEGALHADPAHRPPGRGVLRSDRALVRVQVHADPGTAAS